MTHSEDNLIAELVAALRGGKATKETQRQAAQILELLFEETVSANNLILIVQRKNLIMGAMLGDVSGVLLELVTLMEPVFPNSENLTRARETLGKVTLALKQPGGSA